MEKDLHKLFTPPADIPRDYEHYFENEKRFIELMMMYQCAIREVSTKFKVLNDEMTVRNNRNPIEAIKTRVKSPISIVNKLKRRDFEISLDSVEKNLNDVAGVRIICSFIDDIYYIVKLFTNQDDVRIIEIKDYIKNPKENGYRSYHMIIEIPVFFSCEKKYMRVEVQIRTMAMDFWASLEHQVRYKKDIENSNAIGEKLKECADVIADADVKMLDIAKQINII